MSTPSDQIPGLAAGQTAKPSGKLEDEKFVPLPNLTEVERRELEVILELAGFTAAIKRAVIKSPTAAKAMFRAAIAELGTISE